MKYDQGREQSLALLRPECSPRRVPRIPAVSPPLLYASTFVTYRLVVILLLLFCENFISDLGSYSIYINLSLLLLNSSSSSCPCLNSSFSFHSPLSPYVLLCLVHNSPTLILFLFNFDVSSITVLAFFYHFSLSIGSIPLSILATRETRRMDKNGGVCTIHFGSILILTLS
jgi:hypothetical protein